MLVPLQRKAGASRDVREPRRLAHVDAVHGLAQLHAVDVDAAGIGTIGPREDYLARQPRRWNKQWDATYEQAGLQALPMPELHAKLTAAAPPQTRSAVVHGDDRLGNVLTSPAGKVQAVLDWELAALGNPLADVGWMLAGWLEQGEESGATLLAQSPTDIPGFASRRALAARYAELTSTDVGQLDNYIAFAHWRMACILAGVAVRYLAGVMSDHGTDTAAFRAALETWLGSAVFTALGLLA